MKKKIIRISLVSVTAILVLAILAVTFFLISVRRDGYSDEDKGRAPVVFDGEVKYFEPEGETPYLVKCDLDGNASNQPLKVMSITDTHLKHNDEKSDLTFTVLDRLLKYEKPDFLVICGDLVHCSIAEGRYEVCKRLGDFFEERRLYWAFVLGNHDGQESLEEKRDFVAAFSDYAYCLTRNDDGEVFGETNFSINVKDDKGNITQSLIFMDSGENAEKDISESYGLEYISGYDYIKPDQLEWYKNELKRFTAENGGKPTKSILYIHIALPEYEDAYNYAKKDKEALRYGAKIEDFGCAKMNSGFFDVIKACGSTTTVVCGHDHVNDLCMDYEGITLLYSQSLSYAGYNSRTYWTLKLAYKLDPNRLCYFSDGCTIFFISQSKVEILPQYCENIDGIFDGLEEQFKKHKMLVR